MLPGTHSPHVWTTTCQSSGISRGGWSLVCWYIHYAQHCLKHGKVRWSESHLVFVTPWTECMGFSSQNTWVGSLSLLQGIFPTKGSNPGLPHCRQILYQLRHKGSPRTLVWVAYPFSSGSSRPRVSCIAGRYFTNWAMREASDTW